MSDTSRLDASAQPTEQHAADLGGRRLLTGQSFGVGQMLPMGYDVYNVPYAYRDTYYDTQDAWYRYDDGNIYQVDPYSRLITGMHPVSYGGYAVGYPVPALTLTRIRTFQGAPRGAPFSYRRSERLESPRGHAIQPPELRLVRGQ